MCTVQVEGLSSAFWNGTAFGPGLMFPVIAFPSQLNSRTTCVCLSLDGPQSPLHVPFSGWPNCAEAGIAMKSASSKPRAIRIDQPSLVSHEITYTKNNEANAQHYTGWK